VAARVSLPRLLLDAGLADVATLGLATSIAAEADVSLVHALCRWRLVSSSALCDIFVDVVNQSPLDLDGIGDFPVPAGLHRQLCARLRVLPVWLRGGVLGLGMTDPTDDGAVDQVVRACGCSVDRLLVNDDGLERALRRAFPATTTQPATPTMPAELPRTSSSTAVKGWSPPSKAWPIPAPALSSSTVTTTPTTTPTAVSKPLPPPPRSQPARPATNAPPAQVTTVGPLPRQDQQLNSMDVVLGEPSSLDLFGIAVDVGSALFMDPIDASAEGFAPISPLASQSESTPRSRTPGLPMPLAAVRVDEHTREVDLRDTAALFNHSNDQTHDNDLQIVQAVASDDRTIPDDNLLFLMRVLIIADGVAATALSTRLRPRIKQFAVVPMAQAVAALEQRRYDELIVVDPPDTVAGSQVLATIAARAKNGVVIFTGTADFGRLPGVRAAFELPPTSAAICERVVEVLSKRAHGE